jgi:hypothetical protein
MSLNCFLAPRMIFLYSFPTEVEFSNLDDNDPPFAYVRINVEPQQGEVLISGWRVNAEPRNFSEQVAAERQKIDQELDLKRKEGKEVVLIGDVRDLARHRILTSLSAEFSKTYTVVSDTEYFDWVRLCINKGRQ